MTPASSTIVVVHAGTSDPSSTKLLADQIAARVGSTAGERHIPVEIQTIELRSLATDIAAALVTGHMSDALAEAQTALGSAAGIIASTPIYKAGASGLFTSFFQVLDNDLLIGKPVILAATAGSARHALVIDDQLRSLFAYLRTLPVPTSLFAAPDDWNSTDLGRRISRAATEFVLLVASDFSGQVRDEAWGAYQHSYGSAGGAEVGIDLDTDLMRLATGGA